MEAIEKIPTKDTTYHDAKRYGAKTFITFSFFVHLEMCVAASTHKARIPIKALNIESNINTVTVTP
jgi:hypothetical protein